MAWNRLTVRRSCLALQPDKAFDPEIMNPIQIVIGVAKSDPVFRGIVAGYVEQQEQQVALERDLERVASDISESALIGVTVRSNTDDAIRQLSVRPSQNIRDTIAEAFSCKPAQVEAVEFGGEAVEEGATYEDYGVEVGQSSFVRPGLALCCWLGTVLG